jgi:6-phosphofructokinase 1
MIVPGTSRADVRSVNVNGVAYQSSRKFQIRLEQEDLVNEECLQALAAQTNKTPEQFRERFGYLVGLD